MRTRTQPNLAGEFEVGSFVEKGTKKKKKVVTRVDNCEDKRTSWM